MSWFSDFTSKLQEVSDQVTEKAKHALPAGIDPEMFERFTLTTPELIEERKRLDEQERRKEHIKDCLAGLLPWETRDPERDILVEECKETIMKLSKDDKTFKGPYVMPGLKVQISKSEDGEEDEDDEEDEDTEKKEKEEKPSEESLDKLAKLEPLPKLLDEFDLDAHVGLIQRLLTEDPQLVKMQSKLSGGGEREHYFWKNFFFHCAYARYEAGLSLDEIWSDEDPMERKAKQDAEKEAAAQQQAAATEEEITFEHEEPPQSTEETTMKSPEPETKSAPVDKEPPKADPTPASAGSSPEKIDDFENAGSDIIDDDDAIFGDEGFDELDELEAEIARELED